MYYSLNLVLKINMFCGKFFGMLRLIKYNGVTGYKTMIFQEIFLLIISMLTGNKFKKCNP